MLSTLVTLEKQKMAIAPPTDKRKSHFAASDELIVYLHKTVKRYSLCQIGSRVEENSRQITDCLTILCTKFGEDWMKSAKGKKWKVT